MGSWRWGCLGEFELCQFTSELFEGDRTLFIFDDDVCLQSNCDHFWSRGSDWLVVVHFFLGVPCVGESAFVDEGLVTIGSDDGRLIELVRLLGGVREGDLDDPCDEGLDGVRVHTESTFFKAGELGFGDSI